MRVNKHGQTENDRSGAEAALSGVSGKRIDKVKI